MWLNYIGNLNFVWNCNNPLCTFYFQKGFSLCWLSTETWIYPSGQYTKIQIVEDEKTRHSIQVDGLFLDMDVVAFVYKQTFSGHTTNKLNIRNISKLLFT